MGNAVLPDVSDHTSGSAACCGAVVNTGALLARWTNDTWRATAHRVVVSDDDMATDRYSIACFFDPDAGATVAVDPQFVQDGQKPRYNPITGSEYLQMKIDQAQS